MTNPEDLARHALTLSPAERIHFVRTSSPDALTEIIARRHLPESGTPTDALLAGEPVGMPAIPAQIDEFRIGPRLGAGGMGVVYCADDQVLHRKVAIKVLSPQLASEPAAIALFRQEARAAAALQHPSIVAVYRFGSAGGIHYIAGEFVDGPNLSQLIETERERRGARSLPAAARHAWARQCAAMVANIAEGLECAHRSGIVHRDVKTTNILLDPDRGARLTDFGIATRALPPDAPGASPRAGTYAYMSPEQAAGPPVTVDHRSDIYSLGVVLYELLALRRPFDAQSPAKLARAILVETPASLSSHAPRDLVTICERAMERDPERRYQSGAHLAAELRAWIDGRPILTPGAPLLRRASRWVSGHRMAVSLIVVTALGGAGIALAAANHARFVATHSFLSIDATLPGCRFVVRAIDSETLEPGATPVHEGQVPATELVLEPGQYRATISSSDAKRFAEYDLHMILTGRESALRLIACDKREECSLHEGDGSSLRRGWLTAPAGDEAGAMVLIAAADLNTVPVDPLNDPTIRRGIVHVEAFLIDASEVSNAQYKAFVDATGHPVVPRAWQDAGYDAALADRPVTDIRRADAEAYAAWAGKRLPTVSEWELAMRTPALNLYPWGNEPRPNHSIDDLDTYKRASSSRFELSYPEYVKFSRPVTGDDELSTPTGIHHAMSNASEWTSTIQAGSTIAEVFKGSSWTDPLQWTDMRHPASLPVGRSSMRVGFRCAKSLSP